MHAGSCESSVVRVTRAVETLDRLAASALVSRMRVTDALERAIALMPALTYASVQNDVRLAAVSAVCT